MYNLFTLRKLSSIPGGVVTNVEDMFDAKSVKELFKEVMDDPDFTKLRLIKRPKC